MRLWKAASSIIIVAGPPIQKYCGNAAENNVLVLLLKRNGEGPVLPNHHIFPGGLVEKSDSSKKWNEVFSRVPCEGIGDSLKTLNQNVTLPIFKSNAEDCLPKSISLRIAAIRETFEESGILLCKKYEDQFSSVCRHLEIDSIHLWRQKVVEDSKNFIELCLQNNCYPNVTALNLWSNWLTPAVFSPNTFDAVFFLVILETICNATPDFKEIKELGWYSPTEILQKNQNNSVLLAFPQFYELSRLLRLKDIPALTKFSQELSDSDFEPMLPVPCLLENECTYLLPGDDLYPQNPADVTAEQLEELHKALKKSLSIKLHRGILSDTNPTYANKKTLVIQNVTPKYTHILPFSTEQNSVQTNTSSKL